MEPSGRHAYVANYQSDTISEYDIGADGTLALIGTVAAGQLSPFSVTSAAH